MELQTILQLETGFDKFQAQYDQIMQHHCAGSLEMIAFGTQRSSDLHKEDQ